VNYETREQWLNAGVRALGEKVFAPAGYTLPAVKVSCSWPGGGSARKRIGECWARSASVAGINEIFVTPRIDQGMMALDVLAHELVHAVDDCEHGHRKPFVAIGKQIGLQGAPTTMCAGDALRAVLEAIIGELGPYPHAKLDLSTRKKQSTRNLKFTCGECGAVWRMTAKWNVLYCPCCRQPL
jgi:hypothetical protein